MPALARGSRAIVALAACEAILLTSCSLVIVEPTPSVTLPSATVMVEPLPDWSTAEVRIDFEEFSLDYVTGVCPILAWLDPSVPDGVGFGTYPEQVLASDGSRWATQMAVRTTRDGRPTEWAFFLSEPLNDDPLSAERLLIAPSPFDDQHRFAAVHGATATFSTSFVDSEEGAANNGPVPIAHPATVTVTCS
jgi:hypothetical protein